MNPKTSEAINQANQILHDAGLPDYWLLLLSLNALSNQALLSDMPKDNDAIVRAKNVFDRVLRKM